MIIVLQLVMKSCDAHRTEAALREGRAVRRAAEERYLPFFAWNTHVLRCAEKRFPERRVGSNRAVQIAHVDHEISRIMDCVIADDIRRDVLILALVRGDPCLRAAQPGFL